MPVDKEPVYCSLCQSAVYCLPCVEKWQKTKEINQCCYCKQSGEDMFKSVKSNTEIANVFELAQLRCSNYPNCMQIMSLNLIEEHE